jgi:cell wall-associated NlpC family hydrolase
MSGQALATAAEALLGTRFRLHGREPRTGLDCVGLLAAALEALGRPAVLPNGYVLRTRGMSRPDEAAHTCGLVSAKGPPRPGDVLLVRPHACQVHLLIAGHTGFIHAHAGLRRVVAIDTLPAWPIVRHWRLPTEDNPWRP